MEKNKKNLRILALILGFILIIALTVINLDHERNVRHEEESQAQESSSSYDYDDDFYYGNDNQESETAYSYSSSGEQFSPEAARYAVDNVGADWNKEALETAKKYISMSGFSYNGLYNQLTSASGEQFTPEQANYAIRINNKNPHAKT